MRHGQPTAADTSGAKTAAGVIERLVLASRGGELEHVRQILRLLVPLRDRGVDVAAAAAGGAALVDERDPDGSTAPRRAVNDPCSSGVGFFRRRLQIREPRTL